MNTPRVYADFHNLDGENRLRLQCNGTIADLARYNIPLREGLVLTFYMDDANDRGEPDDLLIEGTVQFNDEEKCWVAAVNWSAVRHGSDEMKIASNPLPENGQGRVPSVK